jgi:hypothetical protein
MVRETIPEALFEHRPEANPEFVEQNPEATLKMMIYKL